MISSTETSSLKNTNGCIIMATSRTNSYKLHQKPLRKQRKITQLSNHLSTSVTYNNPLFLNCSNKELPNLAGDASTTTPADSKAAILDLASPLPPEMIAPA